MECILKLSKEGEEMKKKRGVTLLFIGVVSSVFLLIHPINSCAKSTTMTLTFSDQERETIVDQPTKIPLITQTKVTKESDVSILAKSDQRRTRAYQRRLPTTGEEYNTVLSCLGWATVFFISLFFFIGNYERKGRDSRE